MSNIIIPPIFTEYHEEELDLLSPGNEELIRKIAINNNFLMNLLPLGSILWIDINKPGGIGIPNTNVFQECDGSEITNPNSPLRTIGIFPRFTPDLKNKYPRGANSIDANSSGGTHNHNLTHNHGGYTGGGGGGGAGIEKKGDRRYAVFHEHTISGQYANPTFIEAPKFVYFIAYIKII